MSRNNQTRNKQKGTAHMITREAAIKQIQDDVNLALDKAPAWPNQVIWTSLINNQDYTPNQLLAEVQVVPETEVATEFLNMYVANLEAEERIKQALGGGLTPQLLAQLLGLSLDTSGEERDFAEPTDEKEPTLH
jgi:hypothetical protein